MQFGVHSGCKANVTKTTCTLLGKNKDNVNFLNYIAEKFGVDFVQNSFSALGITFNNFDSLTVITKSNDRSKLNKAKSLVDVWSERDLTFFGKTTIIKSIIYSQFTYLVVPLLRPDSNIMKNINTLIFHFLWGCKRDKIRREVTTRIKQEGAWYNGIILFNDFLLTLFNKLFHPNFTDAWRSIIVVQLKYPDQILVSVENGLVRNRLCNFTSELLELYNM